MFGLLPLYKPSGPTSRDCVNQVQRLIKPVKVGHAGTLDPIASGVLLLLVGNAVRLTDEYHELDKEYIGSFQLGRTSPSTDTETPCTLLPTAPSFTREDLNSVLPQFLGEIEQIPPTYSAVRIDGERAYDLARSGKTVEMPSRMVTISCIEVLSLSVETDSTPTMTLRVVCGTGTYIRSLGRDIARALGSDAVMSSLERTRVGSYSSANAIGADTLANRQDIANALVSPQWGLGQLPHVTLDDDILNRFRMGQKLDWTDTPELPLASKVLASDSQGRLRAVLRFVPRDSMEGEPKDVGLWRTEKFFND
ncbi:tRNA pseudouridine synthase B [Pirellula sp. SH-Sr6A]|uniref:tRNA pseudouridine(55) synthase TruB n=1 Tax=Pirellula sp. SH-Sr6A TaxID=1632865 RepID=UPI00078B62A2|nr:tRNA pseudouridine(55) synthase TruB [Pirellula sp. SH-Sr6A]AMV33896.1 tRNA pseudouridine synthase B [Pirellula sp. SH-Sr6A]